MREILKTEVKREENALANFPTLRGQLATWRTRLAETDWVPWMIVGLAASLRFFWLDVKPPHFDEGENGWFVDQVMKNGFYTYDPTNYHGPLYFYVTLVSEALFGRNVWALRLPAVLVSIACVWLCLKFEPFVGRAVSRIAALAMAVSPGFIFYGRYSIHEVWLALFCMMFILGLLGLWKFGTPNYLWCAGMGVAGMILSKETYIIHLLCAGIAVPMLMISKVLSRVSDSKPARQTWTYVDLAMVIGVGIAAIVFFYSGTFLYWSGVKGLYQAFAPWFTTGGAGYGHEKPWYYWLWPLMVRYEWPALGGLFLCLFCQRFKDLAVRYLAIYGIGTLAVYSYVHYKTPWCIISIIWPFLFTFGAAPLATTPRYHGPIYIVSAIALCYSLGSTIWLNYLRCTTESEPYVYVQTYNDIYKFTGPLLKLAHSNPVYYQLRGHLIRSSIFPLPWILGDFPNIGYYELFGSSRTRAPWTSHDNLPALLDADFLLVERRKIPEVEARLHGAYYTVPLRIRAYQDASKAYFSARIFKDFFSGRVPDFNGESP